MIMEEKVCFEFLQVAVGNRKSLSAAINDIDWLRLFEFCKKQALIGVGFTAVEKLHAMGVVCPASLRMQWMALALQIEKRNALLNEQCRLLTDRYKHDGFSTCILKGQGNCINYPENLRKRRQCGDIDLWTVPLCDISVAVQTGSNDVEYVTYKGFRAVREYVRMLHRIDGYFEKPVIRYHHIEAPKMEGTEVEVHFRPCYTHSPLRNWRMQRWFDDHADVCMKNKTQMGFAVPTSSVNVVYQMCHLFSHYFDEGLGLRQLMDYYFALRVWHNDVMECKDLQSQGMWSEGLGTPVMSKEEVMAVLRSFGIGKFAGAVMWVLHEAFENEECLLELEMRNEKLGIERELPQINRELKENGPQADEDGEQQLFAHCQSKEELIKLRKFFAHCQSKEELIKLRKFFAHCQSKEEFIKLKQVSAIGQQLKENNCAPWMICEPNEVEGRKLLAEIMQGGNFGQYDTRDAALKKGGMMKHGVWKLKRVMRLVSSYPEEALWEPVFRVWHLCWRIVH